MSTENKVGRPLLYETPELMQEAIESYFGICTADDGDEPVTITGLALHLGFCSRQALMNYQDKDEFHDTVKKAKLRIEQAYEKRNIRRGNGGDVFALKQFDWTDKQSLDIRSENTTITGVIDKDTTAEDAAKIYAQMVKGES